MVVVVAADWHEGGCSGGHGSCLRRNGHNPDGCGDVLQSLTIVLLLGSCSLELTALPFADSVVFVTHSGSIHETVMLAWPGRVPGAASAEAMCS